MCFVFCLNLTINMLHAVIRLKVKGKVVVFARQSRINDDHLEVPTASWREGTRTCSRRNRSR